MSSVWLCSRNDIIAYVSVLFAAVGVWFTNSAWPDILIGVALAALFLRSALFVLREAITGGGFAFSYATNTPLFVY